MSYALWTVQRLLALLGCVPVAGSLSRRSSYWPNTGVSVAWNLVHFIGICEVAGARGPILPGLLRIRPDLTVWSAGGLVTIMLGAAIFTPISPGLMLQWVLWAFRSVLLAVVDKNVSHCGARRAPVAEAMHLLHLISERRA
jgi:DoxX-like protein